MWARTGAQLLLLQRQRLLAPAVGRKDSKKGSQGLSSPAPENCRLSVMHVLFLHQVGQAGGTGISGCYYQPEIALPAQNCFPKAGGQRPQEFRHIKVQMVYLTPTPAKGGYYKFDLEKTSKEYRLHLQSLL